MNVANSTIEAIALSVRSLSVEAIERAASGHPGLPLGLAELGALLFAETLSHNPRDPRWVNRDRCVLSAGHGSMLLYSLLHIAGYDLPLSEIERFRQLGSRTPGHPEYGLTDGVETTTGPLGQGFASAVGMAISEAHLGALFRDAQGPLVDHWIYVIASDGDLMEGVTSEASSLAGHLGLNKLIVIYDNNHISIDGDTSLAFSENVEQRYSSYGWQTLSADAYDIDAVRRALAQAQAEEQRPSLICVRSIIGKGAPNKAGSAAAHGAPLGEEEADAMRRTLGLKERFFVHPEATSFFESRAVQLEERWRQWQERLQAWLSEESAEAKLWKRYHDSPARALEGVQMPTYAVGEKIATRKASGAFLTTVASALPQLIGGSADLASSIHTALPSSSDFSARNRQGRTLRFGVREHAMAAIATGIALHGPLVPFCATFMIFSDYMRPSVRMAALMKVPVIYLLSHDSIYLGEDGPTHQPIEHLAALRAIPGLRVLRPADAEETIEAWCMALEDRSGPVVIALTRQSVPVLNKHDSHWRANIRRGAYIAHESEGEPEIIIVASGSELWLAVAAARDYGPSVRVISMITRELFESQAEEYRRRLFPGGVRVVVVEAGIRYGWEHYVSDYRDLFVLHTYGVSAPGGEVAAHFNFTVKDLVLRLKQKER